MHEYSTSRSRPSQARGKERVRRMLSAALRLFAERGLESVTTNDIAKAAGIPIGSLYRYYPNKDAIITALLHLYVNDLGRVFDEIGRHPLLKSMSWNEVLLLAVDAWVQYARLNDRFALLYAVYVNPRLLAKNKAAIRQFEGKFGDLLLSRCQYMTNKEQELCFRFSMTAAHMGISDDNQTTTIHYDAVRMIAAHMDQFCLGHSREHEHSMVYAAAAAAGLGATVPLAYQGLL